MLHHIQLHGLERVIETELQVENLIIKGIALQLPALHHSRTHPVEDPGPLRSLLLSHPLKALDIAVIDAVEQGQMVTGIGLCCSIPEGPEQQLN